MKAWWLAGLERFSALNSRERQLVLAAGLVVFLALLWWVALEPALRGRARLAQQLPALRLQASELAGLTAQGRISRTDLSTDLSENLGASLAAAGFEARSAEKIDEQRLRVRLNNVDYTRVARWMSESRTNGLQLESASMVLQEPGRVNADLVFRRSAL